MKFWKKIYVQIPFGDCPKASLHYFISSNFYFWSVSIRALSKVMVIWSFFVL